jgi:Bacterial Ig-like domain (group 3)
MQFAWTQAGSTSLYAVYSGDSSHAASTSAPVSFTVQKGSPQVTLTAPTSLPSSGESSWTAVVSASSNSSQLPNPTGVVEFWDTVNGTPQLLTTESLTTGPSSTSVYGARLQLPAGTQSLYVHYRGDTNWQSANSTPDQVGAATFSLSVSPNPLAFAAGAAGTGTVTITPSGGFSGTVALTCASGGTFLPAGYKCAFGSSSVAVNNTAATTSISFTVASTTTSSANASNVLAPGRSLWSFSFGAGLLLLGIFGFGSSSGKSGRNFLAASGLLACVAGGVWACGGGSSVGVVTTTTKIASNNAHAAFGTPVTLTVTVKPNGSVTPTGQVQLYDNGQMYLTPVSVSGGIATFLAQTLPVGEHRLTADYLGDVHTQPSTSAPITQAISGSITLQISGVANGVTQTANFTVTVI